jgi:hypothetical protein
VPTFEGMDTDTRPPGAAEAGTSTKPFTFCHFHGDSSETALPVQPVERPSGAAPVVLYACAPCREQRRLTPLERVS